MPLCPFMSTLPGHRTECTAECQLYAPGIQNCSFVASTMLLEDIQKVSVVAYERHLKKEAPVPGATQSE